MSILFGNGTLVGSNTFVSSVILSSPSMQPEYIEDAYIPPSNWILATGFWVDSGIWEDTAVWMD